VPECLWSHGGSKSNRAMTSLSPTVLKKDNVVYLKTSFEYKVLLMCTIIVYVLRLFEVTGLCHLPHVHIWTFPSSALLTAAADVSDQNRGERQAHKTTHASRETLLYSCADYDKSMKQQKHKFKFRLILMWQQKR